MLNKDKYGIVGQIQRDGSIEGGDSACWNGYYTYLGGSSPVKFVKTLEVGFGAYVRHPHKEMTNNGFGAYYKNFINGCISRDQLTGILVGIIGERDRLAMLRVLLHSATRLFLFTYNTIQNGENPQTAKWKMPDIMFADMWATMLRGFGIFSWLFFPLLCILDLHLLIGAIYDKYLDNDEPDVINFIGKLMVAREIVPTPTSWLATKFVSKDNLIDRLNTYWSGWRNNSDFVTLFKNKLEKIL